MTNSEKLLFFITDVFATDKFTGNPLAVVYCPFELTVEQMQKIARELQFKETSFIIGNVEGEKTNQIRIFTPDKEIDYSGHSMLGTAFVINEYLLKNKKEENRIREVEKEKKGEKTKPQSSTSEHIHLKTKTESVLVEIEQEKVLKSDTFEENNKLTYWIEADLPKHGKDRERVLFSKILGIEAEEIDENLPISEITSGLTAAIVPVKTLDSIKNIKINHDRYQWFVSRSPAKVILTFTTQTINKDNHAHVRVFADFYGIPEDPATGSGNGALAAYFLKNNLFPKNSNILRVEQGYELDRPSLILIKISENNKEIQEVKVGGAVQVVAQGEINI